MTSGDPWDRISVTVSHLATRWHRPDKRILREMILLLVSGQPVSPGEVFQRGGFEISAVEEVLRLAPLGLDNHGRVTEVFGFKLAPTLHRIEVDEVALFSCCALTPHVLPNLIGKTVMIESVDPIRRNIVRLRIDSHGVNSVEPSNSVGTLIETEAQEIREDVVTHFCRHVRHFTSPESAKQFVEGHSGRYIVGINDFHSAARQLYQKVWRREA